MMIIRDFSEPMRHQLLPKLKFVPPPPAKTRKQEERPLAVIPREAWPSLKVTWNQLREPSAAELQKRWEAQAGEQAGEGAGGQEKMETEWMEASAPLQPLTPSLSPEYRGEGEHQDLWRAAGQESRNGAQESCNLAQESVQESCNSAQELRGEAMPLTGFEATGQPYPVSVR